MGEGKGSREIDLILVRKERISESRFQGGIDEEYSPERSYLMEGKRRKLAFD